MRRVSDILADGKKKRVPLVAHIIHSFEVGGMQASLANLINNMPPERYRHAIICLTDYDDFRKRVERKDVTFIALHKQKGLDLSTHLRIWKVLRRFNPDIVHNRNLAGLEYLIPAALSGALARIHGEHGLNPWELDGHNAKYNLLRRMVRPFVHQYITVSNDLRHWLIHTVNVPSHRVAQIYNGVDIQRFSPRKDPREGFGPKGFAPPDAFVVGTVGQMHLVKNHVSLVKTFLHLLSIDKEIGKKLRLVIAGDGPLRQELQDLLRSSQAEHYVWLAGKRSDIPDILRNLDVFVLPSLREGISNSILEAMATGLPVVATRVGGNPELVKDGETGTLVPSDSPIELVDAILSYFNDRNKLSCHGQAGRRLAETRFSIEAMVEGYMLVYDTLLHKKN